MTESLGVGGCEIREASLLTLVIDLWQELLQYVHELCSGAISEEISVFNYKCHEELRYYISLDFEN